MKLIIIAMTLLLSSPLFVSCGKYKLVTTEKEKAEQVEQQSMAREEEMAKTIKQLQDQVKEFTEKEKEAEKQAQELAEKQEKEKMAEHQAEMAKKVEELEAKVKELSEKEPKKAVATQKQPATSTATTKQKPKGWVRLYSDGGFGGRRLSISFGQNIRDMHTARADDGSCCFNDITSSVQYDVPPGWKVVLYKHGNFVQGRTPLVGKGSISFLRNFNDEVTSLRWERE